MPEFCAGQKVEENGFCADRLQPMHQRGYREMFTMFVTAVHVDDIVLATKSDKRMVEVKDMGELHHFLGVKEIQNPQTGEVRIGQEAYAKRGGLFNIPAL